MIRSARVALVLTLFAVLPALAAPAEAQSTFTLTVNVGGSTSGTVAVIGTGGGLCSTPASTQCTFQIPAGTTIKIAANAPSGQQPGRLSGGSGPAVACALSTCSFTMTSAASVTGTFTTGDGPVVTLTMTPAGDGTGAVAIDNSRCQNIDALQASACATSYLQESSVTLTATPSPASRFSGFSQASGRSVAGCGGTAQCSFLLEVNASLTTTFHKLVSVGVQPSSYIKVIGETATFTAKGAYSNGVTETLAPGPGAWVFDTSSRLSAPRFSFAFASDFRVIYAIGGHVNGAPSALFEAHGYEENSGSGWVVKAPMSTPREGLAAATAVSKVYAIGGNTTGDVPLASVERYTRSTDSWETVAPLAKPRRYLAAATVGQTIYAVGGETVSGSTTTVVGDVEAYNTEQGTWTPRAPMPTPRRSFALVAANGILYAIGGQSGSGTPLATVEAYDPATDTWTAKVSLPAARTGLGAFASGELIYAMGGTASDGTVPGSTYAYDTVADTWSTKAYMATPRTDFAAGTNLTGWVSAFGGRGAVGTALDTVENFADGLTWSSDAQVAPITQAGVATARAFGTAIVGAGSGGVACTLFPIDSCGLMDVRTVPTDISLDIPANHSVINGNGTFSIGGWAINRSATSGPGVDAVHVYIQPSGGALTFLAVAPYGTARSDIGALYGAQFTNSGFLLQNQVLAAGTYTITAYAHNALSRTFDAAASSTFTVTAPASSPHIAVDAPTAGQTVTSSFEVGGWALDAAAGTGTGVDSVQFYVQPQGAAAPGVFVGTGSYGIARSDVGGIYGSQFTNSGYHFTISGMSPGTFTLDVYARSTVTHSYSIVQSVPFTVSATALMSIDVPSAEATLTGSSFTVAGWSIDRSVEATALSGTGVDTLHVYAYPNPGSGQPPIFLGVATMGIQRPDVAAAYGSRYGNSGYLLPVSRAASGLAPGVYDIVVHAHSAVSGVFNNLAVVRITLQ